MRRIVLLALSAALMAGAAAPAGAFQLAGLLMPKLDPVQGKYRKGNVIRVYASLRRDHSPAEAYRAALTKVAELADAKGYGRVGITKISDCGTLMMNGSIPVAVSCRILAQMVGPGEAAKPEGRGKIVYYSVKDLLAGIIVPEGG